MKLKKYFIISFLWINTLTISASELFLHYSSAIEKNMFGNWYADSAFQTDPITAILSAEGVSDSMEIISFKQELNKSFVELQKQIKSNDPPKKKSKKIFTYLHKDILKKYMEDANFKDILSRGEYNCLTGTLLFYYYATKFDIFVEFISTPGHIYCQVRDVSNIPIEITSPVDGYNQTYIQKEYLEQLLKYKMISQEEYQQFGKSPELYRYSTRYRLITIEELIGYQYLNLALFHMSKQDINDYFDNIEKALVIIKHDEDKLILYKLSLLSLAASTSNPFSEVSRHFKNAFILLHNDKTTAQFIFDIFCISGYGYLEKNQNYSEMKEITDDIYTFLPLDTVLTNKYIELKTSIYFNCAVSYYNKGRYQECMDEVRYALSLDSLNTKIKELYIDSSINYAEQLSNKGEDRQAQNLLKPLLGKYLDYVKIRDTYITISLKGIYRNRQMEISPENAVSSLLSLHTIDPENVNIKNFLAMSYQNLAINYFRKSDLKQAEKCYLEGLKYCPNDPNITQKLKEIRGILYK